MKRLFSLSVLLLSAQLFFAQTAADALRYAYLQPGGTARYLGAGGALGALGADFSTLSTNPAGLAMFRTDEFMLTPALRFASSEATLRGEGNLTESDDKSNFNFNNLGIVFNTEPDAASGWKTFNVGLGFNRQANFHSASYYKGNSPGTILNGWFSEAKQTLDAGGTTDDLYPFGAKMAYDANAIYYQDNVFTYDFDPARTASLSRQQALLSTGGVNEMAIAFAGNYDEQVMVGATIGVPFVKYELQGDYTESDLSAQQVPYFDNLRYTENLRTNGLGVNMKLGFIYRPLQMLRFGAAFHTPTFLSLTDNYTTTFSYSYSDGGGAHPGQDVYSPDGTTDYRLRTPWRAMLSGAVLFKKYGFLSADVEMVDYSASRFNLTADVASSENQAYERELNNQIRQQYQRAMNVRLGGEAALGLLRLRAGANLLGKPVEGKSGFDMAYTAGFGIRSRVFYFDMGFRFLANKSTVQPYSDPELAAESQPIADAKSRATDVLLTVGFKF